MIVITHDHIIDTILKPLRSLDTAVDAASLEDLPLLAIPATLQARLDHTLC